MVSLSSLADLVTVRNHLRMLLDHQYRNISRDDDKALRKLLTDLDQLFLDAMKEQSAQPAAIFYDLKPDEIIAALRKLPSASPGDVTVVNDVGVQLELDLLDTGAQPALDPVQKKKVIRGKKTVKANKDKVAKQTKEVLDKETQEMRAKIAQAKQEVAAKKTEPKAIEPLGDGTES